MLPPSPPPFPMSTRLLTWTRLSSTNVSATIAVMFCVAAGPASPTFGRATPVLTMRFRSLWPSTKLGLMPPTTGVRAKPSPTPMAPPRPSPTRPPSTPPCKPARITSMACLTPIGCGITASRSTTRSCATRFMATWWPASFSKTSSSPPTIGSGSKSSLIRRMPLMRLPMISRRASSIGCNMIRRIPVMTATNIS